jgi:lipoprotein-anchoring transpeptidase ErfK/SrfK
LSIGGLAAVLAACTSAPADTGSPAPSSSSSAPSSSVSAQPAKPLALTLNPPDKAAGHAPGEPITVTATDGKLTQVGLAGQDGKPVAGQLAADGLSWQSTEPLGYGKTYVTTATGQGADGKPATASSTFTTATARRQVGLSMNPLDGQTVGVGQPLAFYFSSAVTDRKAAERAIHITTTPATVGAFYWFDNETVFWRPKDYWKPGTKVTVNAAIYGKQLGDGVYGREDRNTSVTIGDAVVATADGASHQMTVMINGQVARTIPISMGKRGHETPYGTYVAMSEHTNYTMDSSTYGVPADSPLGYRTTVSVATRLSNSGIFYHSAPWSLRQQGSSNVSHGCINMSTENARWLQSVSNKGDVFILSNTGGQPLEPTDGLGVWQIPWQTWSKGA